MDVNRMKEENDKELSLKRDKLQKQEEKIKKDRNELDSLIEKKADQKTEIAAEKIKKKYDLLKYRLSAILFCSLYYGFSITLMTGINSIAFKEEAEDFFQGIGSSFVAWGHNFGECVDAIEMVSNAETWANLILLILALLAVIGAIMGVTAWMFKRIKKYYADELTAMIALILMAVLVFLSEIFTPICPINLVTVVFALFFVYVVIRSIIDH